MKVAAEKITQEQKRASLRLSIRLTYAFVPLILLLIFIFRAAGFVFELAPMLWTVALAFALASLQLYLLKQNWLVDVSYGGLLSLLISLLIIWGIYNTGAIISPFVWVGIFGVVSETLNFGQKRGLRLALPYLVFLWGAFFLEAFDIHLHPQAQFVPGFDVHAFPRFIMVLLSGYTLLFVLLPVITGVLMGQIGEQKQQAMESAEESKKATRMALSMMEDLEAAKKDLEARVRDIEDSRRATLHLLQDIEEAKEDAQRHAEETKKLYDDLKVVDRMKTEFLSVISHELRTPLTPIKGYISMFLSGSFGVLPEGYKKGAEIIKKEADHLLGLIDGLLDVSRLERGKHVDVKKEPLSIRALAEELLEVMQPQFEARRISARLELPGDFPVLMADETKLRRLFTNLLGNALKFTPEGGWVKIAGSREGDQVRLQVADNGIGIASGALEKVFDKFFQVDSSFTRAAGGVGLGLPICKEIAEVHGGRMWAESDGPGKGARFCFTLPVGG